MIRAARLAALAALAACAACAGEEPLANAGRAGLACATLEEVAALPEDEIDLGVAALLGARVLDPDVDVAAARAELDAIARDVRARCAAETDPAQRAWTFVWSLYAEHGFRAAGELESGTRHLPYVLAERRGNCVGLSLLYLAVAERVGLPLAAVAMPFHLAVRWDDGERTIELEPTTARLEAQGRPDAWFFSERDRDGGQFLVSLSRRETLAHYLIDIAAEQIARDDVEGALRSCDLSLELDPDGYRAHLLRGAARCHAAPADPALADPALADPALADPALADPALADPALADEALADYERALELRPDDGDAWGELGYQHTRRADAAAALAALDRALELDPRYPVYWLLRARAHRLAGDVEAGLRDCEAALAVPWTQIHPFRLFALRRNHPTRRALATDVYETIGTLHLAAASRAIDGVTSALEELPAAHEHEAGPVDVTRALDREIVLAHQAFAAAAALRRADAAPGEGGDAAQAPALDVPWIGEQAEHVLHARPELADDPLVRRYRERLEAARAEEQAAAREER